MVGEAEGACKNLAQRKRTWMRAKLERMLVLRAVLAATVVLVMTASTASPLRAAPFTSDGGSRLEPSITVSIAAQAAALRNVIPAWSISEPQLYRTREARRVPRVLLLHNFDRVSQKLYRGGQPQLSSSSTEASKQDGITLLRAMGVTDLIDLREPSPERTARERARCASENISYHAVPLPSLDLGLPIFNGNFAEHLHDVAQVVALIKQLEDSSRVIYVHCAKGADRTGVVVAMLRLLDGASLDVAMSEAHDHSLSIFQRGMRRFIERHAQPKRLARLRQLVNRFYYAPLVVNQRTESTLHFNTPHRTYDVYPFKPVEAV